MERKHIAITAAVAAAAVILVGGIGLACTGLLNGEPDKATPENSLPSTDKPVQDAKQQISAPDESGDAVPVSYTHLKQFGEITKYNAVVTLADDLSSEEQRRIDDLLDDGSLCLLYTSRCV